MHNKHILKNLVSLQAQEFNNLYMSQLIFNSTRWESKNASAWKNLKL